mmetsp:Transcript_35559/g.34591  ORF Transcript_35559/g.34591 Transcript_35559/m.34591 type:complete len:87 (-) Transcript_35559:2175-2435(-)
MYPGTNKQTEMNKIYQALIKEKVTFPSEESVFSSLCPDYNVESQAQRSPSSTNLSSVNQSYNKLPFQSHQVNQGPYPYDVAADQRP